ncbi:MAG: single-stranded DNA-binding protein [Deltaproteobacteria bacterium]|nr:single-stranded DNA-binding protein [Deltaproteobacteria bacterium]
MASVNKVILIGHLGRDPEMRRSQTGKNVTQFSMATSERWNNEDHVEWHKIILFDRVAEVAKEYLRKGSQVYIEGRIRTNIWEDQNGVKRYTTEILASHMVILSTKKDGAGSSYPNPSDLTEETSSYAEGSSANKAKEEASPPKAVAPAKPAPPKAAPAPKAPVAPVAPPAPETPPVATPKVESPAPPEPQIAAPPAPPEPQIAVAPVEPVSPAPVTPAPTEESAAKPVVDPKSVKAGPTEAVEEYPLDAPAPLQTDGDLPF